MKMIRQLVRTCAKIYYLQLSPWPKNYEIGSKNSLVAVIDFLEETTKYNFPAQNHAPCTSARDENSNRDTTGCDRYSKPLTITKYMFCVVEEAGAGAEKICCWRLGGMYSHAIRIATKDYQFRSTQEWTDWILVFSTLRLAQFWAEDILTRGSLEVGLVRETLCINITDYSLRRSDSPNWPISEEKNSR